jgi:hypothetical protein
MLLIRDSGSSDTQGTASRLRGHCHASREAEPQMEHFTAQRQIEAHLRVNASVALSPSKKRGLARNSGPGADAGGECVQ